MISAGREEDGGGGLSSEEGAEAVCDCTGRYKWEEQ